MKYILAIFYLFPLILFSQQELTGVILSKDEHGATYEVAGANVYWLNTSVGVVTDIDGSFKIVYQPDYKQLVVSYVGYQSDTLAITSNTSIRHFLKASNDLDEVNISSRNQATSRSYLKAANVITVSSEELLKAACCNLSESFETNPSIDVNFADAVTGTRQIKMLGLTSPYILITTENIPTIRGASQAYGLSFIPGTWVESIQITKGAGSVVNGFESIAGQINAELVKPATDKPLFVNLYIASSERMEANIHLNQKLSDKWSTGLYLHGNSQQQSHDVNNDSFLDMPLSKQINLMNRWQYTDTEKGVVSFINLRYLNDAKQTGQVDFDPAVDKYGNAVWGSEIDTERFDLSVKTGFVNPELPWRSLGIQTAFSRHVQNSYFGSNSYDIEHHSLYANAIYNSIISDSRHKIKMGLSYTNDYYKEKVQTDDYNRSENSVGAFFEYNFDNLERLNLTAGIRIDQHNLLGTFITPRFHARYSTWGKSALRFSFGRGKRSANIFAENQSIFSTSRNIVIREAGGKIFGLDPEIAWNYGLSLLQGFNVFGRAADVSLDYYRTDFQNQVVVDFENSREINFYNLDGKSYANSYQLEINYNALQRVDLRAAYKYYDVKTQYDSGLLDKPLTPKHRIFANVSYQTASAANGASWKFDTTFNWLGRQRFSSTSNNPASYQLASHSPTVATLNAQLTKVFSPTFEIYLGGENVTNTRQSNPIISSENPFGDYFDTTFVYGPIFGSMYYLGLRFKIN